MTLRVVSWNMGGNFYAAKNERAWHYLCALDPDVAFLQEAKPPEWARATFQCLHRENVGQWCTVIAGRNVSMERIVPSADGVLAKFFDGYVVRALATLPNGRSLSLASVHTPALAVEADKLAGLDADAIRRRSVKGVWFNDLAYWALRQELAGSPFLVLGDWNTARRFGADGTEFFARAAKHGWFECLRKFYEEEQRTYFKKNNGPYELDHAFCSPDLASAITSCYVDANAAENLGLSDHAPIVMELDL